MNMFSTKTWVVAMMATLAAPAAMASVPWIGTADYLNAPGAQSDEALVGPFDTYDFGGGIGLIKPDTTVAVGNTFTGWFQTYVNSHMLGGAGLNVPSLNTSGSGSGFELTAISQFTGTYTSLNNGLFGFTINAGTATLRFDSNPNYSFASDSGFSDGAAILSGSIVGGSGLVNTMIGYGFEVVSLDMSGAFSIVDGNVYNPGAINGGEALFSITMNTPFVNTPVINQVLQGSQSVLGNSVGGGQLFELDGNLKLTQVPVPSALWLFVTGIASLVSIRRKTA